MATKRNCKECGGLLTHDGQCTKCNEAARVIAIENALNSCRDELKQLKASKAEGVHSITLYNQTWSELTSKQAYETAKALLDLGVRYMTIK